MNAKRSRILLGSLAWSAACGAPAAQSEAPPPVAIAPQPPAPPTPPTVKDPNLPSTWVPRLSDPDAQANAVERLAAIYEAALRRDEGKRDGPNAKPVADAAAQRLNDLCHDALLDAPFRKSATLLLARMRDPRGVRCLLDALEAYGPGFTDEEMGASAKALAAMGVRDASAALFRAFTKVSYANEGGARIARDVHDAMVTLVDPEWEEGLIWFLDRPMPDRKDMPAFKDAVYRQVTMAEMLGLLRSEKGIEPLLRIMLSPSKADAQSTAAHALLKIGKPVVGPAAALLRGENKALVAYALAEAQRANGDAPLPKGLPPPHVGPAALVLGAIGREECAAALLEALPKTDPIARALIARELVKVPATPATTKAFKKAYEATPVDLTIPPGMNAREALLEQAAFTYDAELVPWVVQTALALKGEPEDVAPVQEAALITAMKLMTEKQVATVEKLHTWKIQGPDGKPRALGSSFAKEWSMATAMLSTCKDDVECWLRELGASGSQAQDGQFRGVKAAYMVGVLGKAGSKPRLVEALSKIENPAAFYVAARALDRLSPKGDPELAGKLEQMGQEAQASANPMRIAGAAPLREVVSRLRARAQ